MPLRPATRQLGGLALVVIAGLMVTAAAADAQSRRPQAARSRSVQIGGYGMFGAISFAAADSFDAVLGKSSGPIFGGGATVGLPFGGLFFGVGAWRFSAEGERVLVAGDEVVSLGIPMSVTITPLEVSGGWRFRLRGQPGLIPYVAGGLSSYGYKETSEFAGATEDVDDRFTGYHVGGGVEVKLRRWLGVAGEFMWTTVPDALGEGGVSEAFNETDLGGTGFRVKITVGR